jgi:hypothetical protein
MDKTVRIETIEPHRIDSPALDSLNPTPLNLLWFYEGWHYVDGEDYNVGRIFIAVDTDSQEFAVMEEGNSKVHGWYDLHDQFGDELAVPQAFHLWCFYPRELVPSVKSF